MLKAKHFDLRFRGLMDPHVAVHGSFSVMVNYHAIGLYCTSRSGFVLHDPQEEASLKVSVLVFTGEDTAHTAEAQSFPTVGTVLSSQDRKWLGNEVERLSAATIESMSPEIILSIVFRRCVHLLFRICVAGSLIQ